MENTDVIVILFLASIIGIVSVSFAAIAATYKSLPQWAQSLTSSVAEFALGEVEDLTDVTENDIDDKLLEAIIIKLEAAGVITRVQTVDAELFSSTPQNQWMDTPKPSVDEDKEPDAKPAA